MNHVRKFLVALTLLPLLLAVAACGSEGFEEDSGGEKSVVIVGQKFTEADILTQLYKQLLEKEGFKTDVKTLGARDIYLDPLEKGDVQVSADYLSSMTEALNRKANGDDAAPVASPDVQKTLEQLKKLAAKYGITPLEPAKAEDANSYAVTKDFAEKNKLTTLSDLGKLGKPVALAANSDCPDRPDCAKGLTSVYGIKLSKVEPLGFGSPTPRRPSPTVRWSSARWAPRTAAWTSWAWWCSRTTRTGRTPRTSSRWSTPSGSRTTPRPSRR